MRVGIIAVTVSVLQEIITEVVMVSHFRGFFIGEVVESGEAMVVVGVVVMVVCIRI